MQHALLSIKHHKLLLTVCRGDVTGVATENVDSIVTNDEIDNA